MDSFHRLSNVCSCLKTQNCMIKLFNIYWRWTVWCALNPLWATLFSCSISWAFSSESLSVSFPLQPQDETDEELLDLILQRHLTVHVVHAAVYPSLVEHLLSKHDPQAPPPDYLCVNVVANELIGAGLEAEAGSLVARSRGTHRALQTFDLAVSMLSKWLPKWVNKIPPWSLHI